jgi:histidinol-phosphate aminotransferase
MNNLLKNNTNFRNLYALGKRFPIDLSLSENPLGCSPKIFSVFKKANQKDCFDYPDPDSSNLIKLISQKFNIESQTIFVSNGSESIIKLLPQTFLNPSEEIIISNLTFPLIEKAIILTGGITIKSDMTNNFDIDLQDIRTKISKNTKLIFICNPNNPTGRVLSKKNILDLVKNVKIPVIIDEANIEFGGQSVIAETKKFRNLIVLRTFSKAFGLAGLRIGFCVANKNIINNLRKFNQPFPVSSLAQKAAVKALQDQKFIAKSKLFMRREIKFLSRELKKKGFKVINSQANNLWVRINPKFTSSNRFITLLNQNNTSVVNGRFYGKDNGNFVRISPRTREVNLEFLKVLDKLLKEKENNKSRS